MTELLRTPKEVVAQTATGAVRITRRDAADLILLRADELENTQRGTSLALRIAREALRQNDMAGALRTLFPWSRIFTDEVMGQFAAEMEQLVWAAAELGRFNGLLIAFAGWQATAEALADNWLPDQVLEWLPAETAVEVERP